MSELKVKGLKKMTAEEVMNMTKEHFSEFERKDIIDLYRTTEQKPCTEKMHSMLVGRAAILAEEVATKGGTDDELDRALEYLLVCIDSMKFNLDVNQCYRERKIEELFRKYDEWFQRIGAPEKRKRMLEIEKARKRTFRKNVQELKEEGFSNYEIAKILKLPESTVRAYSEQSEEE